MASKSARKPSPPPTPEPAWRAGLRRQSGPVYWTLIAVLLWVLLAVMYPGPMLQGKVFLSSDASNSDAFAVVGDAALAAGDYPQWNPYLFAGMPTFGSLAYPKFVYPPAQVFNFLQQKLGFAPLTWWAAHLLFGGLGMAWLLSRWRLPTPALLLGAVIFLLFPKVVAWGVHGHGSKLGAAMYLPWVVGLALRVMDDGRRALRWRALGLLGLLMGLQFLRGHVQITYYTLATVAWLGAWNAALPFEQSLRAAAARVRWGRFGLVLGGLGIGFLVGAVLLVPVHDYAGISIRGQDTAGGGGVGLDYATGWSLAPDELGTLVFPAAAGFGKATYMGLMPFNDYPNYVGFLLLLLAAAAWSRATRPLAICLGVFAVLVVLTSFGGDFYAFLYDYLPFFNKFRVPSMILVLVAFAVALLAPRGLTRWRDGNGAFGKPLVLPGLLAVIGLGCVLGGAGLAESSFTGQLTQLAAKGGKQAAPVLLEQAWLLHKASLVRIGLVLLAAAGALWFSLRHAGFRRLGLPWVLILLVLVDLGSVNRLIVRPETGLQAVAPDGRGGARLVAAPRLVRDYVPVRDAGPGPGADAIAGLVGHDRLWPLGRGGGENLWMGDRIRSLGGYHPAKLAAYEKIRSRLYSDRPDGRLASWLGGRAVSFDQEFSPGQLQALKTLGLDLDPAPVFRGPPVVYRNDAALPRARLVTGWAHASAAPGAGDLDAFLDAVSSGRLDPGGLVHLSDTPVPAPGTAGGALPAPEFVRDGMDEVVLAVETPVPAVLVLADMNAPGWRVEVDGEERPLLTADLVLRAVALDAGRHEVRFHYDDPALRRGLTLTTAGVILILGLLALSLRRDRQDTGGNPATAGATTGDG